MSKNWTENRDISDETFEMKRKIEAFTLYNQTMTHLLGQEKWELLDDECIIVLHKAGLCDAFYEGFESNCIWCEVNEVIE